MPRILSCLAVCLFCASAWAQPFLDSFDFHIISQIGGTTYYVGDSIELLCTAPYFTLMPRPLNNPKVTYSANSQYELYCRSIQDTWIPYGQATSYISSDTVRIWPLLKEHVGDWYSQHDSTRLAIEVQFSITIDTCTDMKDSIVCQPVCDPNGCWPQCDTLHIQHCAQYNYETKTFYDTTDVFAIDYPGSVMPRSLVRNQRGFQPTQATYNILGRRVPGKTAQGIIIGTNAGRRYLTTNLW